jgi:hypothetical protein
METWIISLTVISAISFSVFGTRMIFTLLNGAMLKIEMLVKDVNILYSVIDDLINPNKPQKKTYKQIRSKHKCARR